MKQKLLSLWIGLVLSLSVVYGQSNVVISEIYGGGGNTGATYKNDFIELYNPTSSDITMSSWSVQYTSAAGTTWGSNKLTFSGVVPAKGYFLIKLSGGTVGADLPAADAEGSVNLSATAGKVALCNTATSLSAVANPADANIVDKVGYGSTATGFETAPAPAPSNSSSIERKALSSSTSVTMATGGADVAKGNGYDSNDNSLDFIVQSGAAVNPQNKTSATEGISSNAPSVTFNPSTVAFSNQLMNTTSAASSYVLSFSNLTSSDLVLTTSAPFSISKAEAGTYSSVITFTAAELTGSSTNVYVQFSPSAGGSFNGTIAHSGAGLSSAVSLNVSGTGIDPNQTSFNFNNCSSTISDGFTQFSVTGAQTWACTNFGHDPNDATNKASLIYGLQINGFANSVNNANEDWVISPALNISSFTYPLLSFWSRNKFAGSSLQLKVSTNYSGSGSPYATGVVWNNIDGKFPATNTDIWTLSDNIDLSAYKSSAVYIAFVYTSSTDDGARWTLDDIVLTNSSVAPAPQLSSSPTSLDFGFQAQSTSSTSKSLSFTLSNLTDEVKITAPANFSISSDNITFGSTVVLDKASSSNKTLPLYVKFSPMEANKNYNASLTIQTTGGSTLQIALTGSTVSTANTLEVVNWNVEWFAGANGPTDDAKQKTNVIKVLKSLNADIFALGEVVNVTALADVAAQIGSTADEYGYYVSSYGSYAQTPSDPDYANAQKLAFIYRKSIISPIEAPTGLLYTANESDPVFNYWASGRFPYQLKANVTLNGITKPINFIMIHAKAETSSGSYTRRVNAAASLKTYLDNNEASDNFIILGDYNDDLDFTISDATEAGGTTNSSYKAIVDDNARYKPLTLPLSLAGKKSTTGYNDVIDHVVVSNELYPYYLSSTAQIMTSVEGVVSPDSYGTTTSDHYPVLTRYAFDPALLPLSLTSFTAINEGAAVKLSWKTESNAGVKFFEVERSGDSKIFSGIKSVEHSNATGYTAVDESPEVGINYYRIKEVKESGETNYSPVRKVTVLSSVATGLVAYPNPFTNSVKITAPFTGNDILLTLTSISGSKVFTSKGSIDELNQRLSAISASLGAGTYVLSLEKENQVYKTKILKY